MVHSPRSYHVHHLSRFVEKASAMRASRELAEAAGRLLAEHRGGDVLLIDLAVAAGWTDWFVLATATSSTHLRGLARSIDEWATAAGADRRNRPNVADDEEWVLIDLGDIVVHLMTGRARAFYELEKLWFQAPRTAIATPEGPAPEAPGIVG